MANLTWPIKWGAGGGEAFSGTANRAVETDGDGALESSAVTDTELGYLDGVSSGIQAQIDAKQASITGAATTIDTEDLTADRALISSGAGKVAVSGVTATELGYLDDVTSAIQTQLDAKIDEGAPASFADFQVRAQYPHASHIQFFEDFIRDVVMASGWTDDGGVWYPVIDSTGTAAMSNAIASGLLLLTTAATDDDFVQITQVSRPFLFTTKKLWFEARIKRNSADNGELLIGTAEADSTVIAGVKGVYFFVDDGDANIDFVTDDGTQTKNDTGVDLVADTYIRLGMYYDGAGTVTPYVDGAAKTNHTTHIPGTAQGVCFAIQAGSEEARVLSVDWVHVVMER